MVSCASRAAAPTIVFWFGFGSLIILVVFLLTYVANLLSDRRDRREPGTLGRGRRSLVRILSSVPCVPSLTVGTNLYACRVPGTLRTQSDYR